MWVSDLNAANPKSHVLSIPQLPPTKWHSLSSSFCTPPISLLPSPYLSGVKADPTYMTKVFGLGGGRATGRSHRGRAGRGIFLQAGFVQPIFRRGVCWAHPRRRWVLRMLSVTVTEF